ncbi:MAG: transglutaminase domain-containing protein [Clostridiales bacterium]|nr:transglutaminase domain-containing protein [Clostridiales bacterium]
MFKLSRRTAAFLLSAALACSLCACSLPSAFPAAPDITTVTPSPELKVLPIPNLEKKYFLSQLSGSDLEFCTIVYAGLMALEPNINVSSAGAIDFDRADALIQALFDDCPELYMCAGDYTIRGTLSVSSLDFKYRMNKDEYYSAAREVSSIIGGWKDEISALSDYEKALYVYDAIAARCTYSAEDELGDTAYGALTQGKALCQGYSKAFQLVMQSLGLRCLFVSSEAMVHGWNIIELDGSFYQLDLTWDDSGDMGTHAYFNMSDELAQKLSHVYDRAEGWEYPVCDSMELNYYELGGLRVAAGADAKAAFLARLDELYAAGGGRLTLLFDSAAQLSELAENQNNWVSEWNSDKHQTVLYTRIIPENNDYVYIADFSFE